MNTKIRHRNRIHSAILVALALVLFAGAPAFAEQGDWLIRLRGIQVDPDSSSGPVRSDGAGIAGSSVSVDDDTVPELDITYMFRDNWGLELILATTKHDVTAEGTLGALGEIMDTGVLPPTLLLQYHFAPEGTVRPYVGAGINFTLFYDEDTTSSFDAAAGAPTSTDLDSSLGPAGQIGLDIGNPSNKWFFNIDVKYIDLSTDATIQTPGLGRVEVDVDIDPFVWGIGFGWRI